MESCVTKVMKDGHDQESAIRICKSSLFGDKKQSSEEGHKPTSGMKSAAARAIKWREQGHKGGTNIGATRARQIVNGESLSDSTVKRMHSFFSRHAVDKEATGFNSGEEGYPSPGRVAWDLWGGNAGASWSARIAEGLKKKSTNEGIDNLQGGPQQDAGQNPVGMKICPQCNTINPQDATVCTNRSCGANLIVQPEVQGQPMNQIQAPYSQAPLHITKKIAQMPDEPKGSLSQEGLGGPGLGMPTQEIPPTMGENVPNPADHQEAVQDPKAIAAKTIADKSAAKKFSQLDSLDNSEYIIENLAQKYNLPPEQVGESLIVEATVGDFTAIDGEITKQAVDPQKFTQVNIDDTQGEYPTTPVTDIDKVRAEVPLKDVIKKIQKDKEQSNMAISEEGAQLELEDDWAGVTLPDPFPVNIKGSRTFYLPSEMIGPETQSPFEQNPQLPEDVMDQEYNQVPMQPAH